MPLPRKLAFPMTLARLICWIWWGVLPLVAGAQGPAAVIRLDMNTCLTHLSAVSFIDSLPAKYTRTVVLPGSYAQDGARLLGETFGLDTAALRVVYADSLFAALPESPRSWVFIYPPGGKHPVADFELSRLPGQIGPLALLFPQVVETASFSLGDSMYFSENLELKASGEHLCLFDYTRNTIWTFSLPGPRPIGMLEARTLPYEDLLQRIELEEGNALEWYMRYQAQMQRVGQAQVHIQSVDIDATGIGLVVDVPYPKPVQQRGKLLLVVKKRYFYLRFDHACQPTGSWEITEPAGPFQLDNTEAVIKLADGSYLASVFKDQFKGKRYFAARYQIRQDKLVFQEMVKAVLPAYFPAQGMDYDFNASMIHDGWLFWKYAPQAQPLSGKQATVLREPDSTFTLAAVAGTPYGRYAYFLRDSLFLGIFHQGRFHPGSYTGLTRAAFKSSPTLLGPDRLGYVDRRNQLRLISWR